MTDRYTGTYWKLVMSGTGIYWNFDCVVYLKMKNILENILEYTGISEKNRVAALNISIAIFLLAGISTGRIRKVTEPNFAQND